MTPKAPDVCQFENKMIRQLARNRKIDHVRVRSSHAAVDSPADSKASVSGRGRNKRKTARGSRWKFRHRCPTRLGRTRIACRQHRQADKTRNTTYRRYIRRIHQISSETERTFAVKAVHHTLPEVIVINAIAASDRASSVRPQQPLQKS